MNRIVMFIERLEKHLLRWLRLATVVVVALVIVSAALTFLVSLMNMAASTDVSVGSVDSLAFSDPSIENREPRNEPDQRTTEDEQDDGPYASQVSEMVGTLQPLMDAGELDVSPRQIRNYVEDSVEDLASAVSGTMGLHGNEATNRLDAAVDGMVDYVDDLVDYYGEEISLETSNNVGTAGKTIHPAFKAHLEDVLQQPLIGYVSAFREAAEAALAAAEREAAEGRESIASGLAGMASLPMMGMLGLALLFLLLLFKIEIRLSEHDAGVLQTSEGGQEAQE